MIMKKISNIIFLLLFSVIIIGCNDDKDEENILKVVEKNTDFTALGGTGKIVVETSQTVTVTSDQDWCKVSLSDNIITVTVEPTSSLESRVAYITIKSNNKSTRVTVAQNGSIFYIEEIQEISDIPLAGGSISFKLGRNDVPEGLDIKITDDWLNYEIVDGRLIFVAEPSQSFRSTDVAITYKFLEGSTTTKITISQKDKIPYSAMLGEWELSYIEGSTAKKANISFAEGVKGSSFTINGFPKFSYTYNGTYTIEGKLILTFDPNTSNVNIANNQVLQTLSSGNVLYFQSYNNVSGYINSTGDLSYEGIFKIENEKYTYTFREKGPSWANGPSNGFRAVVRESTLSSSILYWTPYIASEYKMVKKN